MKAYSVDLREKIIAAVGRRMSKAQAARTFGVGATSVKRYVKLAEEGKPLTPGKAPGKNGKLDGSAIKLLEENLHSRPAVIYADITYLPKGPARAFFSTGLRAGRYSRRVVGWSMATHLPQARARDRCSTYRWFVE